MEAVWRPSSSAWKQFGTLEPSLEAVGSPCSPDWKHLGSLGAQLEGSLAALEPSDSLACIGGTSAVAGTFIASVEDLDFIASVEDFDVIARLAKSIVRANAERVARERRV